MKGPSPTLSAAGELIKLPHPAPRFERRERRLNPFRKEEDRMKEHLDKLSRDLASGMTRRGALRLFFSGIGAAAVGVFLGRSASADDNAVCVEMCRAQGLQGREFGECVSFSAHCPENECAVSVSGNFVCVPVG
jgi:hypothetical protein